AKVTAAVNQYFPNIPFVATSTFGATWDSVPYSSGGGVVTFQLVLAYNIHRSFVLIYYGDLARTGQQWQAGYNTVDSVDRFIIPASSVSELSSRSNVNVIACWAFHVDGSSDLPANFLPLGKGERVTPRLDNGSSEAITLEQPFQFFGRTHNQTYVSNNGLLTFTGPTSDCNPILHSGKDLIAPLWTHLDNTKGGTISYREETNITVLAQITATVKANLTSSAASSAFIVTWDSVPYYSGRGAGYDTEDSVSSFTMPVSNPHDLSSVGNTNVDGRCSFKVDGSSNVPTNFPAPAIGNIVNPMGNNGSSYVIFLKQPFTYFQRTYQKIFLNSNGFITFTEPLSSQNSSLEMKRDIIAPFWTRLDNRVGGTVSYREDTSTVLLAKVTAAVNQYFPNIPFVATSTFVATWDSVPYSSGGGVVTFQLVLAYNIHRSFVLIYYGDLARTGQQWQAGYNTVDSVDRFIIPASSVSELSSRSNVNVIACWAFHVDGSSDLPANFLPLGKGERVTPRLDNGSSEAITLEQPFQFFGRTHNQTYVSNNGLLTFTGPTSDCNPILHSGKDLIAPLWTHLDNTKGGTISYREETNITVLAQITATVKANLTSSAASSAFIVTWDSVPYYSGRGVATFQAVLLSNEDHSFMLVNYGNVSGTDQTWLAGYDTEDSVSSFTMPVSNPHDLSSVGNTNVDGRCSFKVDGSSNVPTNFPAPAIGNIVNPMGNNGSSYVIFLKQPFTYFQRTYQKIFLNSNGFITFTEPLSSQNSSLEMKRDIIAPFWTRLDNRVGGTVSYREDTSTVLLAKVTAAVNQYFPNIPFVATSTFVATWDSVPYSSGGGVVTFQLVLPYNIHRSFVLIYYGDLARTGQQWQAGYNTVDSVDRFIIPASSVSDLSSRSNVNVTACWAFHVDGSSDCKFSSISVTWFYPHVQVHNNGFLTFDGPCSACIPTMNPGRDIVAPLWTNFDVTRGGTVSYREDTSCALLAEVTASVKDFFPNSTFAALSAFITTWNSVPYSSGRGMASFQLALISNADTSFIMFNYGAISDTDQKWIVTYDTVDFMHSHNISLLKSSELSSSSNINVTGRWLFQVNNACDSVSCSTNKVCSYKYGYGCGCTEGQRPNPKTFDAIEVCASSTGSISLSRCQLFEFGFLPENLHLNDPNCTAILKDDRVLFYFDNEDNKCGTSLSSNGTHFIYKNSIHSNLPSGVITREKWANIAFSCAYPLIQSLTMPKDIQAEHGVLSVDLPGQGTYWIRMIPYYDCNFTWQYEGAVEVQVNQKMYVAVEVEGVDRSQIATVLDNCWATPVNDINYQIRWNLIVRECPNPDDGTVEILQNGIDTTSRFSFRTFTFTGASNHIYLHCQVHLCLVQNGKCAQLMANIPDHAYCSEPVEEKVPEIVESEMKTTGGETIETFSSRMDKRLDMIVSKLENKEEVEQLKAQVQSLTKENADLKEKCLESRRYRRRWDLRLTGLTECDNEDTRDWHRVIGILTRIIPVSVEKLREKVDTVHRLERKNDTATNKMPQPIIIQFGMRTKRDEIWRCSKDARVCKEMHIQFKGDFSKEDREAWAKLWPLVEEARQMEKEPS
ncbi:hypothetical protein DNTS_013841, partial [Danionella cerebrum]